MKHRWRFWIGLGALAVVAAGGFVFLHTEDSTGKNDPPPPRVPVRTTSVMSGEVPIELEALGRVTAFNTVTIRPLVGGQIIAVKFKDGQAVQQGDPLVQIDPRPLQATVEQDKANSDRDRASLASAEADLKRYVPLLGNGVISAQQVSDQRAQVAQLRATVAADQAALSRDQVQLGYTAITAPFAGILGLKLIDVGNIVSPSDPAGLVVLTQIQPITVLFALPQANLGEIQAHQAASSGGLIAQAWSQDGSRQLDQGVLSALSNQVDASSGTVTLKGTFPNLKQSLWPGASVTVRLVLDVQHDGLTVPSEAMNQGPAGPFVWVVASDGTAHATPVGLRQQLHGQALISSGLQAGEQVVTNGQYGLTSGAHVAVQKPQAQASTGGDNAVPLHTNQPNRLGISP